MYFNMVFGLLDAKPCIIIWKSSQQVIFDLKSKWAYAQTAALEGCLTLAPGSEAAVWDN